MFEIDAEGKAIIPEAKKRTGPKKNTKKVGEEQKAEEGGEKPAGEKK